MKYLAAIMAMAIFATTQSTLAAPVPSVAEGKYAVQVLDHKAAGAVDTMVGSIGRRLLQEEAKINKRSPYSRCPDHPNTSAVRRSLNEAEKRSLYDLNCSWLDGRSLNEEAAKIEQRSADALRL